MIALNLILMTTVVVGIVSLLGWAIVSDRRSKRSAGALGSTPAALHHDLVMPHELRVHRTPRVQAARARQSTARAAA